MCMCFTSVDVFVVTMGRENATSLPACCLMPPLLYFTYVAASVLLHQYGGKSI